MPPRGSTRRGTRIRDPKVFSQFKGYWSDLKAIDVVEWVPNERIVLEANTDYWHVESLVVLPVAGGPGSLRVWPRRGVYLPPAGPRLQGSKSRRWAMWGPGWWGQPVWGFWWIFPLIGMLVCLTFMVMAVRFMATGRGFMCMGGHHGAHDDGSAETRREIEALREEIRRLKASRETGR